MIRKNTSRLIALCVLAPLFNIKMNAQTTITNVQPNPDSSEGPWSVYLKGFVQADAMIDFQEMGSKDGFAATSIKSPQENSTTSYFSVRQSQLGVGIKQPNTENGISAYVEIDFFGPNGTTAPRFRKGYIEWKNILVGQTWSNFSDIDIFPNIFDFAGPNGTMFIRTLQVRYSAALSKKQELSLSLEDPAQRSVRLPDSLNWKSKAVIPSFTGMYRYGGDRDYIKVGGIISPISYEAGDIASTSAKTQTTVGFAGMVSGKLYTGNLNNFRLQSSYGKGYSNYNIVLSGEQYDAVPDLQNNKLKTLNLFNILGIYEHWWSPKWSSVAYYSYSQFGKDDLIPKNMLQNFQNAGLNIVYQPYKKFRMGIEGNYGKSKSFDNKTTEGFRIQCSTAFSF
ncbi:DcaP family trimeric outer membrane transporter [Chryseobacterium fistulae]|uniref:Porin n=1 Tax=Chryseobacterium fistulae TaxID=2675058 RepID=A0A6N4XMR4_9FLAO|nr:DcaP family trimeric outer membrane transporter [Chryseobacterium fistulae]CAA7387168.1 hypothetical protein CHRY9393_01475 [Chryseobacterium fistulae]